MLRENLNKREKTSKFDVFMEIEIFISSGVDWSAGAPVISKDYSTTLSFVSNWNSPMPSSFEILSHFQFSAFGSHHISNNLLVNSYYE